MDTVIMSCSKVGGTSRSVGGELVLPGSPWANLLGLLVRANVRRCARDPILTCSGATLLTQGVILMLKHQRGPSSAGSIRLITSSFCPLLLAVYFFYWAQLTRTDGYGLETDIRGRRREKQASPRLPRQLSSPSSPQSSIKPSCTSTWQQCF